MKRHVKAIVAIVGIVSTIAMVGGILFLTYNTFFYGLVGMLFCSLLSLALTSEKEEIEMEARRRLREETRWANAEKAREDFEAAVQVEMERIRAK